MNIVFLVNRYPGVGGIENMTTLLSCLFKLELGYETSIFSIVGQGGIVVDSNLKQTGIEVKILNSEVSEENKSLIVQQFKDFLLRKNPDVVIFQDSYAPIEFLLYAIKDDSRFSNIKICTVEHNTPDCLLKGYIEHWKKHSLWSLGGLSRKLLFPYVYHKILSQNKCRHKKLVEFSDKYILLSSSYKKLLKNLYNIDDSNITAIANIKNDFIDVERTNRCLDKKEVLLFVGRLNSQKGIDKLIDVWRVLGKRIPAYELVIVGDGEERELLEQAMATHDLKNIRLEGFKNNVSDYYQEASAILMTSIFEGLPLVLAEAMQFGVVPFAYDTFSSLHDIIDHHKTGYIIKPFNVDEYAESVCAFLNLPEASKKKMRHEAMKKSEKFSKSCILNQWKDLLENEL